MSEGDQRIAERVPASLRVRLKYSDESAFIEKYAVNISRGGIFIATRSPKPVGTTLRFDMLLESGEPVVRGEGAVVWVKPYDAEHPDRAHGMGVRFTWLDEASRMVIDRALAWKEEARRRHEEEEAREELEPPPTAPDPTRRVDVAEFMRQGGQVPGATPDAHAKPSPPPIPTMEAALQTVTSQPIVIELEADEPADDELELELVVEADAEVSADADGVPELLQARVDTAPIGTREPPAASRPFVAVPRHTPPPLPMLAPEDADTDRSVSDGELSALVAESGLDEQRIAAAADRARAEAAPLLARIDDSDEALVHLLTEPAPAAPAVSIPTRDTVR